MADFDHVNGFEDFSEGEKANTAKANDDKKAMFNETAEQLSTRLKTDPAFAQSMNSLVDSVEVIKLYGFSNSGSMQDVTDDSIDAAVRAGSVAVLPADSTELAEIKKHEDGSISGTVKLAPQGSKDKYIPSHLAGSSMKDKKGKDVVYRALAPCPGVVGYLIQNCGTAPIEYVTAVCAEGADGVWTSQEVTKTLEPGQQAQITKEYFCRMVVAPEFNLNVKNGFQVISLTGELNEAITKSYFRFKDSNISVNSPEVKTLIHDKVTVNGAEKFVVQDEYAEVFGLLNNEKAKEAKKVRTKKAGTKIQRNEVSAAMIRKALRLEQ